MYLFNFCPAVTANKFPSAAHAQDDSLTHITNIVTVSTAHTHTHIGYGNDDTVGPKQSFGSLLQYYAQVLDPVWQHYFFWMQ
jgi:gamma-glutamylcysteine synthetase